MIFGWLGSIPLGSDALTGPVGQSISRTNTFAQYDVTRGKPVLHEIGEELDTQSIDFFFSEEFCSPETEKNKLEVAFALKTPMPLLLASGSYFGKLYVVDTLDLTITKYNRSGGIVRVEATIALLEAPVPSLFGLITSVAKARAPAIATKAVTNPNVRR